MIGLGLQLWFLLFEQEYFAFLYFFWTNSDQSLIHSDNFLLKRSAVFSSSSYKIENRENKIVIYPVFHAWNRLSLHRNQSWSSGTILCWIVIYFRRLYLTSDSKITDFWFKYLKISCKLFKSQNLLSFEFNLAI